MKHVKKISLCFLFIIFAISVHAKEVKEHPLIRPLPGSQLVPGGEHRDFSEYTFKVKDPQSNKIEKKKIKGKFWKLTYRLYDAKGNWGRFPLNSRISRKL